MKEVRVLVAEEEKDQEFEKILSRDKYLVLKATCSETTIEMAKEEEPDLMILDLELPGMNGMDVLRRLQTLNFNLPVVAVSSTNTVRAAVEAMKLGARDYLTKPLNTEELMMAVRKGLQKDKKRAGESESYKNTYSANCPDVQMLIDEVKETMLERKADLEEAKRTFEERLLSVILEKANGDIPRQENFWR